jgi:hypothetical protein
MQRLLLVLAAAALVAVLAVTVKANDSCPYGCDISPYYPTPSWDQQLDVADRFLVLVDWGNSAVLDRDTGLVWEAQPVTTMFGWMVAMQQCHGRLLGNRRGWRLPSYEELTSLLDATQSSPALPAGNPFIGIGANDVFWTATQDETASGLAYVVGISSASTFEVVSESDVARIWCVRGGSATSNPPY